MEEPMDEPPEEGSSDEVSRAGRPTRSARESAPDQPSAQQPEIPLAVINPELSAARALEPVSPARARSASKLSRRAESPRPRYAGDAWICAGF